VRVQGPDAADLLQRIASNDVLAADVCEALLLTAKGRVIAPLLVWRRGEDDFLLLTEPELGPVVLEHLRRMRIASRCEIEPEEHTSTILLGAVEGIPTHDYGVPAVEVLDAVVAAEPADDKLERLRILARTPRWGREIDDDVLPAEAGLEGRAVSFSKVATRARSRWRDCTIAATSIAACGCSTSPAKCARPTRSYTTGCRRPDHECGAGTRPRLRARRGAGRRRRRGRRHAGPATLTHRVEGGRLKSVP